MIVEGENYTCIKTYKSSDGFDRFKKGKSYFSEANGYLTDERENMSKLTGNELKEYFEYIPSDSDDNYQFSVKAEKFIPIADEDLQLLNDYFMTKYTYCWDEIGYMPAEIVNKDLLKLQAYIDAIKRLNKKLLLT